MAMIGVRWLDGAWSPLLVFLADLIIGFRVG